MTEETREQTGETEGQHTERRTMTADRQETGRQTMAEISHTNPNTGETFGTVYRRGPAVADGSGDARGTDADPASEDEDTDRMRDVDHTPRDGDGANEVWERGDEERPDVSDGVAGDE
jgi:hypothetical protein